MSRRTRDGTAEPVSRGQILRRERGQKGIFVFPVQLTTSTIGNLTRFIHTLLCVMTIHTYILLLYDMIVNIALSPFCWIRCPGQKSRLRTLRARWA